jgi:hypothetical protein
VGHVELRGGNQAFLEQVLARYAAFEMPTVPETRYDFSLRLELRSAPPPGTRDLLAESEAHPLKVTATERSVGITRWDLALRLAADGRGRRRSYQGRGHCEMNPFSVDCILRVLWATLLPRVGGMLVHGCGLRHAEVAVVFPGPSGAGKTTLARKAPDPDHVLSDELCAVRRGDDGWRVHGTPFWGDFARGGISMRSWPLRTLAFLTQAPRDTVTMTPIVSAEATFRLLGCFLSHVTDRASIAQNVGLAVQLASEVRSVEASLTKGVPAPAIFRKLAPHLGPEVTRKVPAANTREMISDFRSLLRKQGSYTFQDGPRSTSPGSQPRGRITVRLALESELGPGDIGLYWRPGRTPDADTLVCRRIATGVRSPKRAAGTRPLEVLGKVDLGAQAAKMRPAPRRVADLDDLSGTLVASLAARTTRTARTAS